jgi:hypothetical protein
MPKARDRQGSLTSADFFVLRTPLLPFDELVGWSAGAERDRPLLRARLRAIVARPEVREAIFLGSPSLAARLDAWVSEPAREAKVERALVRYLARIAGRAVPFGLFAGISVGCLGPETTLAVPPPDTCRRVTALDIDALSAAARAAFELPALRARATLRPCSSL